MRRPWIKVEVSTPDKPEVCAIATRLKTSEDAVVGKLIRLWGWMELNRVNPDDLGVTPEFLDKLVSKKGFSAAMAEAGWLRVDGEKLWLPNFTKYNGQEAKVRGLTALRVARHRKRKMALQGAQVEHAPPETQDPVQSAVEVPPAEAHVPAEPVESPPAIAESQPPPIAVAVESSIPDEVIPAEPPIAVEHEVVEPAALETAVEPVEPDAPPKRRSKAERQDDNQPMLF